MKKKQYIAPQSLRYNLIEPLAPLCASQPFEADDSAETDAAWSNKMERSSIWDGMKDQ